MNRRKRRFPADLRPIVCLVCGATAQVRRSDARTCGPTCKKRLQRWHRRQDGQGTTARDLAPEETRFRIETPRPAGNKGDNMNSQVRYPHGSKVLFNLKDGAPLIPGRINWYSKVGEECSKSTDLVPVEDLRGVHKVHHLAAHPC